MKIRKNGNVLIILTLILSSFNNSAYENDFQFWVKWAFTAPINYGSHYDCIAMKTSLDTLN